MPFRFVDNVDDADIDELTRAEYGAYKSVKYIGRPLLFGLLGDTNEDDEIAIETGLNMNRARKSRPGSRWNKVIDESSGRIVGAAMWVAVDVPPTDYVMPEAGWLPPGSDRDAGTAVLVTSTEYRAKWPKEPYLFLQEIFVLPDYQGHGLASLMLDWGVKFADEQGWQIYLNAAVRAVPLYEKFGFILFKEIPLSLDHLEQTERLQTLREAYLPHSVYPMVRPVRGIYRKGIDKLPWEHSE